MSSGLNQTSEHQKIRVYVDGCFDLVHYGHANVLRQAKLLGNHLVAGVHSDEDILLHKGPPVFSLEERVKLIRSIKWVDEVILKAPFPPLPEFLDQNNCDFCAHGDDHSTMADGSETYRRLKECGRYKEVPRTQGVSTTDLVGRMLLATKSHHKDWDETKQLDLTLDQETTMKSPYTGGEELLTSSQRLLQFAENKDPQPGETVIYVDGDYDLFHAGHVYFLEKCLEYGSYIIVGIHSDQEVNKYKGANYPIMNLFERTLIILSCRYVSNVIIGAPYVISEKLLKTFGIHYVLRDVAQLKRDDELVDENVKTVESSTTSDSDDPYAVPKRLGIYKEVDSNCKLSTDDIIKRIIENRLAYEKRNRDKENKEINLILNSQN